MVLRIESDIRIGDFRFQEVNSVSYERSIDLLGSTAVIKLPTSFTVRNGNTEMLTEEAIKPGDAVSITFYDDLNDYHLEEFIGYVSRVSPKTPVEVHCEDSVWLLRQKNVTHAFNDGCTLAELLNVILEGVGIPIANQVPEVKLDKYVIKDQNAAQVLQRVKKDYGLNVYIDDLGQLFVGLGLTVDEGNVSYNLDKGLVANDLEFKTADQRKIKVKYTYVAPDNKRTVVEAGDSDGDVRSFHTSVVSDEATLKKMAEAELEKLKFEGYEGSVTSFIIPYATPGMSAQVNSDRYPNREGKYFVRKTQCELTMSGGRRKVILGVKL